MAKTHIVVSVKHGLVFARNRVEIGAWVMHKRMRRAPAPKRYHPGRFEALRIAGQFTKWWWSGVRPNIAR